MKAHVNELLLYSRLPFHFWTELNGGRWPFDNPGCSVLSLCSHKLNQQLITVPDQVAAALEECREFSTSPDVISKIIEWIEVSTAALVGKANELEKTATVFKELTGLMSNIGSIRSMMSVIFSGVTPVARLDLTQELTLMFMQSLIDVKDGLERLGAAVINANSQPTGPEKA